MLHDGLEKGEQRRKTSRDGQRALFEVFVLFLCSVASCSGYPPCLQTVDGLEWPYKKADAGCALLI